MDFKPLICFQEVLEEIKTIVDGVVDAIVYPSITDKSKNRGFAFIEFESHRAAAIARRKLIPGHVLLWDQPIAVDWAEPEQEVDEDVMSKVRPPSWHSYSVDFYDCNKKK